MRDRLTVTGFCPCGLNSVGPPVGEVALSKPDESITRLSKVSMMNE